jgi:DNA polymerase-1
VSSVRGKPFDVEYDINGQHVKFKALATYHPAALLRTPNLITLFKADIMQSFELLYGKAPESQAWGRKGISTLLKTMPEVEDLFQFLMHEAPKDCGLAFDYETESLNRIKNTIATIGLAFDDDTGFVLPIQHQETPFNPTETQRIIQLLQQLFAMPKPPFGHFIGQNVQFDLQVQSILGIGGKVGQIHVPAPVLCTMLMAFSLDENRAGLKEFSTSPEGPYSLGVLGQEYLGFTHYGDTKQEAHRGNLHKAPLEWVAQYQGMDAYVTHRLATYLIETARKKKYDTKMLNLAANLTGKAAQMLGSAEQRGIFIDLKQLHSLSGPNSTLTQEGLRIISEINASPETKKANDLLLTRDGRTANMKALFGKPFIFDIKDRAHQEALYFEVLKLEPIGFTEAKIPKPQLDKKFLEEYEDVSPLVKLDQERRGIKKLTEAYINSTTSRLNPYEGDAETLYDRSFHTHFLQTRAVTGRLASKNPNVQQIPKPNKKIPWRTEIRKLFVARPGHVLIQADYSQAEVRWWAQVAGDQQYAAVFHKMALIKREYYNHANICPICGGLADGKCETGEQLADRVISECDPHRQAASLMNEIAIRTVTKEDRQDAKSLVFGGIYGRSIKTIAQQIGKTEAQAQKLFDRFMGQFPRSAKWLTQIEEFAASTGYVESPFGRQRRLNAFMSGDRYQIAEAKRQARNAPIQGAASDSTLLAACTLYQRIQERGKSGVWWLLALIHDAIIAEVPFEDMEDYIFFAEEILLDTKPIKEFFGVDIILPFEVEFDIGTSLGTMETWGVGKDSMWRLKERLKPQVEEMARRLAA